MSVETFLGTVPLESDLDAESSQTEQTGGQSNQTPTTTPAVPSAPSTEQLLQTALQTVQQQQKQYDTLLKRHEDFRSYTDKRFSELKQSLRPNTPQDPEDWNATISDRNKFRQEVLDTVKQATPESNTLTPEEVQASRAERLVRDFERQAFRGFPPEKANAYSQYMFSIISEQVDDMSEITPKLLQGAFKHTDKIFSAAIAANAGGNGNSGNQPKAGNVANGQPSPEEEATAPIDRSTPPHPVNITGSSGMPTGARMKAKTMDDLRNALRRVKVD